jgi:hypothetical protein
MSATTALLRIEWRALRRAPWRTALLLTLIALPAAALVAATALQRTMLPSSAELAARRFDGAAALVTGGPAHVLLDLATQHGGPDPRPPLTTLDSGEVVLRIRAEERELTALAREVQRRGLRLERADRATAGADLETAALQVGAGFGFALAALIVGAAVAVALARREREFARVAACGAEPRAIVAAVALALAGVSVSAALLGCALGAGLAATALRLAETWSGVHYGALRWQPSALPLALALGLCATGAAAAPALLRLFRRLAAAGGTERSSATTRAPSRSRIALALLLVGLGAAIVFRAPAEAGVGSALAIAGGAGLALVGLGLCVSPTLHAAARLLTRAPLPLRLAARDADRARGRSGAAALAVLGGLAGSAALGSLGQAVVNLARANGDRDAVADPRLVLALIAAFLFGLGVVAAAAALDAAEAEPDTAVLRANGASPRTLIALHGVRAAHLALVGGALSLPAGLLPALGLVRLADVSLALALPWRELAVALVALPLAAFLIGAALGTGFERAAASRLTTTLGPGLP